MAYPHQINNLFHSFINCCRSLNNQQGRSYGTWLLLQTQLIYSIIAVMCFVCNHRTLFLCELFINFQVGCQKYDGYFFRTEYSGDPATSHLILISNFIIIDKSAEVQASFGTIFDQLLCQSKYIFLSNRLKLYLFIALKMIAGIRMHLAPEAYTVQFRCCRDTPVSLQ